MNAVSRRPASRGSGRFQSALRASRVLLWLEQLKSTVWCKKITALWPAGCKKSDALPHCETALTHGAPGPRELSGDAAGDPAVSFTSYVLFTTNALVCSTADTAQYEVSLLNNCNWTNSALIYFVTVSSKFLIWRHGLCSFCTNSHLLKMWGIFDFCICSLFIRFFVRN